MTFSRCSKLSKIGNPYHILWFCAKKMLTFKLKEGKSSSHLKNLGKFDTQLTPACFSKARWNCRFCFFQLRYWGNLLQSCYCLDVSWNSRPKFCNFSEGNSSNLSFRKPCWRQGRLVVVSLSAHLWGAKGCKKNPFWNYFLCSMFPLIKDVALEHSLKGKIGKGRRGLAWRI